MGRAMKRLSVILVTLFALIPVSASAGLATMGVGTTSCGQFAKLYQDDPRVWEDHYFDWAQGFMSGMNWASLTQSGRTRDLGAMPVESQQLALRNYCDKHPLGYFVDAVMTLFQSFREGTRVPVPAH